MLAQFNGRHGLAEAREARMAMSSILLDHNSLQHGYVCTTTLLTMLYAMFCAMFYVVLHAMLHAIPQHPAMGAKGCG